jgi:hypothetical protein
VDGGECWLLLSLGALRGGPISNTLYIYVITYYVGFVDELGVTGTGLLERLIYVYCHGLRCCNFFFGWRLMHKVVRRSRHGEDGEGCSV